MNIFRSTISLLSVTALALGIISGAGFAGAGSAQAAELVSETRELTPFNRVDARGSYELRVSVGEEQSVRIEAAERDLKRIKTEIRGETLVLSYKERWFSFLFDEERIVTISLPELRGIELSGAGDINVAGIESEALDVSVNGAADTFLAGTCGTLNFDLNGAGEVLARKLQCKNVRAEMNGVGSAELYASDSITATMNGLGAITVYGNPENVSKEINGFGDFEVVE